ncbi:MAG: pvadh, partial [Planctomycetaceae bacterium]|nr:pvadh [Planctomycetaceae bacterium]
RRVDIATIWQFSGGRDCNVDSKNTELVSMRLSQSLYCTRVFTIAKTDQSKNAILTGRIYYDTRCLQSVKSLADFTQLNLLMRAGWERFRYTRSLELNSPHHFEEDLLMSRYRLMCLTLLLMGLAGFSLTAGEVEKKPDPIVSQFSAADWPWWRGPKRNGIADSSQSVPLNWSNTDKILWKSPVPGRGHGAPTVVGEQVFLATADHDQKVQSVLCYDRQTGKELWRTEIHHGGFETKGNSKSSLASSTIACDGKHLFINFLHSGAIYTTSLTREGKIVWQEKITDYILHQGFGSSPAIYQNLVIVSADNKGTGVIVGLDRTNGKTVWKQERPKFPNYTSPIILNVAGRDQLLFTGCELVTSFEPLTGKKLWEIPGSTTECVTSTVTDGKVIITSGGYPKNHMSAVQADGSGTVVWENKTRVYVPSMIVSDGYLYAILDAGVAKCWKCDTGKEIWEGRLSGTFSASPILVGNRIYATNEAGKTFVLKATPESFEILAENQLGDEVFATPTICGGRIYFRVANQVDGKRQEQLICVGEK